MTHPDTPPDPFIIAGIPATNNALYHRIRFLAGDPAAYISIPNRGSTLLIRDIETARARKHARADTVTHLALHEPPEGLSGDRETATAQAAAQILQDHNINAVRADRTLPLAFHHELTSAGIAVRYDPDLGVTERRAKDDAEIEHLAQAQKHTEQIVEHACRVICNATPDTNGILQWSDADGSGPLTAERLRSLIAISLLKLGYEMPHGCVVAPGPHSGDPHERGTGPIRTGEPVVIDVFPRSTETRYHGDCTRTACHGQAPPWLTAMHNAVIDAKQRAQTATHAGATGEQVHRAATAAITAAGFPMGLPPENPDENFASMPHGTGHGTGLDVHEPPLLDLKGPELVAGDALTIEPGLYNPTKGGVRVEDLVIATTTGIVNLNTIHTGLHWN